MRKLINSAAVLLTALFLSSCSPSARLQRLIDKHPDLAITTVDTIYQPKVEIDTFYTVTKDTAGLSTYVDSLIASLDLDTACRDEIIAVTNPVATYILNKECIEDTLYYTETISTDSTSATLDLKIYQDGDDIKFIATLRDAYTNYTKTEIKYVEKRKSFWKQCSEGVAGAILGIIIGILLIKLFNRK